MKPCLFISVAVCAMASSVPGAAGEATVPAMREAVQRSLPFIEKTSTKWMAENRCNSCHVVTFHVWSHTAAAAHGLDVDKQSLTNFTQWALSNSLAEDHWQRLRMQAMINLKTAGMSDELIKKLETLGTKNFTTEPLFLAALEKAIGKEDLAKYKDALLRESKLPDNGGGPDTLAQLLLGRSAADEDRAMSDSYAAVRALLLEWQEPDGSWLAAGQLPGLKWEDDKEMNAATTMWSLLALSAGDPTDAALMKSRERALAYLQTIPPGKTAQTLALRLIIAHQFSEPAQAKTRCAEVLSRQNPDGGWSWWQDSKVSDAFATGQVLYALGTVGRLGGDPEVGRAWQFLLQSQGVDGRWEVPQQGINKKVRKLNVYPCWGTAWAAIGILQTMPVAEETRN
ncbi:MAG: 2,3-oxidosqualene cyclase [Prosthecobacter sp.]|nr:2,3-oxidosqualene cyclase [Prosthecobacter sp.]